MNSGNNLLFIVLAVLTGALIPVQAATNTAFSRVIGNPYITGLMVFSIGLLSTSIFLLATRTSLPTLNKLAQAPAYSYAGGLVVAVYVIMITIIAPRIGVGNAIGLIVTGQILCAVVIDHFGLFQIPVQSMSLSRLLGVLLMIAGIYLVMRKGNAA